LVGASLSGNRDAFGQIVARYQSLVCSLAFSATGSLSQSEDLAQETFVTAWKQMAGLREPEKLRAWLCGIARNLINNSLRKQGREPSHRAEALEEISESHSPEPQPIEQAISNEELAILWRALERIPEIYREPLVLFYREHQSVEAVAQSLELSEDAVKQRLSRGRKLLHELVLAFVEGALERTKPGKVFTLGVLAVLPVLTTTAKAAAAGTAAAKGGAMVKATGLGVLLQAIFKIVVPIAPFVSLGGWLGYKMGRDAAGESQQRKSVTRFWSVLVACLFAFVLLPILLWLPLMVLFGSKENLLAGMRTWLDIMFAVVVVALILWVWQRRKSRREENTEPGETRKTFFIWSVVLAMIVAASLFTLALSDSNWKAERISTAEAQKIVAEKSQDAQFFVLRFHYHSALKYSDDYYDELWIKFQENGKLSKFIAPADKATLSLLTEKGIKCPIYVQGRDFEIFGWQGKLLMGLFLFILPAGAAVLLTLWLKNKSKTPIMTKGTKTGIVAAIVLAALIVTPLVWLNHRKVNSVQPNRIAPQSLTPERAAQAKQTAKDFFEALGKADWNKIDKLCPPGFPLSAQLDDQTKTMLNGLEVVSLGDPFTKTQYPQVWVPYEIRFKSGESKKFNLAVRQDNPEQKWYFDGGF
jgi:RNA polymerase sigma factor (sigma-70 family)